MSRGIRLTTVKKELERPKQMLLIQKKKNNYHLKLVAVTKYIGTENIRFDQITL